MACSTCGADLTLNPEASTLNLEPVARGDSVFAELLAPLLELWGSEELPHVVARRWRVPLLFLSGKVDVRLPGKGNSKSPDASFR